jgi:hypothetical protein
MRVNHESDEYYESCLGLMACGARQNFLDRIYKIYRISLRLSIHYSPAWVDDRPEAHLTLHIHYSKFKRSAKRVPLAFP